MRKLIIVFITIYILLSSYNINLECQNQKTEVEIQTTTITNNSSLILETNMKSSNSDFDQLSIIMDAAKTWLDETEIKIMTNCLYGEARGLDSLHKSAVVWCILNRYDAGYGTITEIVTYPKQFTGYKPNRTFNDTKAYQECRDIVIDVYCRWYAEKLECENVGRTLPSNYLWFSGNGKVNTFRDQYSKQRCNRWDWSLENPYEEDY